MRVALGRSSRLILAWYRSEAKLNAYNSAVLSLGWACRWGRIELVKLLLDRGADPVEAEAEPWATRGHGQKSGNTPRFSTCAGAGALRHCLSHSVAVSSLPQCRLHPVRGKGLSHLHFSRSSINLFLPVSGRRATKEERCLAICLSFRI